MTETDLRIIHSKLDSLSERLDRLEVQFNLIRQSIEKDSVRVTVNPDPSTNHFLEVGDFLDPGIPQKWRNKDVQ